MSVQKLLEEAEILYNSEKSKENFFHTSYFQTLAEFLVWYHIFQEKQSPKEMEIEEQLNSGNLDLGIAIKLVQSLNIKNSPLTPETKKESPPPQEKPKEEPKKKEEEEVKGGEFDEDFDEEMDEELKNAILLSKMEENQPQEPKKGDQPPKNEEEKPKVSPVQEKKEEKNKMTEVPPFKKVSQTLLKPKWLSHLIETTYLLETVVHPQQYKSVLTKYLKSFWQIKNESILERIIIVQNLPKLSLSKQESIKKTIVNSLKRFTNLSYSNLFLPFNDKEKLSHPFCLITLPNSALVPLVISKLESAKIKSKRVNKSLKVSRLDQALFIDNFSALEERENDTKNLIYLFLQSKLINSSGEGEYSLLISSPFASALLSLFIQFTDNNTTTETLLSFPNEHFISKKQFDSLFFHAHNTHFKEQELSHIFSKFKGNKLSAQQISLLFPDKQAKGEMTKKSVDDGQCISFSDFLFYFNHCAKENALEVWRLLSKMGYDFNCEQSCFNELEAAYQSQLLFAPVNGKRKYDEDLISYAQEIANTNGYSLSTMPLDLLFPLSEKYMEQFKSLSSLSVPALRLRFAFIKFFNKNLGETLPLIKMNSRTSFHQSISHLLSQSRDLIFLSVKTNFSLQVFDKTSSVGNQPSIVIERLNLLSNKQDLQSGNSQNQIDSNNNNPERSNNSQNNFSQLLNRTSFGIAMQKLSTVDTPILRQKKPPGNFPFHIFSSIFL